MDVEFTTGLVFGCIWIMVIQEMMAQILERFMFYESTR